MAEVLSQDEIDQLLSNVTIQDIDENESGDNKYTPYIYDFKHPNRVSKDQLRNLRTIHESYARMLATYLTTLLRTMVDVNLLSIDQVTFLEFTMAMSNPGCIWLFEVEKYEGKGIMEISPGLMLLTIERLFGGEGKHSGDTRSLSVIEQNVAKRIIAKCLQIYDESWERAASIETKLVGFEMNPQFVQIAPASETAVVMFLEVSVRDVSFQLSICFPYFVLDPIIQELSSENWLGMSFLHGTEDTSKKLEHSLRHTSVDLVAFLGETKASVKDILELKENDILVLDKKTQDMLEIQIGGKSRFLSTAGKLGDKMAVRIEKVLKSRPLEEGAHTRRRSRLI